MALYGKQIDGLIDTGATISVLSSKMYLRLPESKRPDLSGKCGQLRVADGKVITPMGMAMFPLEISGKVMRCRMLVADIEIPAVIGYAFMRHNNCVMDVGRGTVEFNGETAKSYLESQRATSVFKLSLDENVVKPASSEMMIPTRIVGDIPVGHEAIINDGSSKLAKIGVLVGKSIFEPTSKVIPVPVANVTGSPQTLYKKTIAAECLVVRACHLKDIDESTDEEDEYLCRMEERPVGDESFPEHMEIIVESSKQHLVDAETKQLKKILKTNEKVFAKNKDDLGKTNLVYHKIDTGNAKPVKQAP
ncbi:uncharacterized protein [Argopecten irradians]|uniref:uncharacterized protein n=1 Tax=Argopecten irradians TaxID=31199 RepID=UPI003715745E